jgi:propionyl-CoA carboxylase alpha chain
MTAIRKLLIANRGEIALRVIRTARDMDIATVAVFSEADSGAPFVRAADEAVPLPGNAPADSYLNRPKIIEAALRAGADAVHPGYGFLSENAGFARDCAQAGLTFVGPPPEAIEAMGSKTAAKELMAAAGVPVLPAVEVTGPELATAAEIGFPLLVKAAFGGGGRGMRVVRDAASLPGAVASAQREAAATFGDGTVFLERYLDAPRHIEVQIFGDRHGNVVHLFERECSIQRRYQKIIEEAPSPAVDDALRRELGVAAVAAGKAIGYVGAGTVEFVLDSTGGSGGSSPQRRREGAPRRGVPPELAVAGGSGGSSPQRQREGAPRRGVPPELAVAGGSGGSSPRNNTAQFYFLEVNTRLQVEHPVTELVTGLDLVALQILAAEGRPLPDEVRFATLAGHAVEARLYAEDTSHDFRPATGTVHTFTVPDRPGLRVDAGITAGSQVGVHYDALLAKVIAHGATRDQACRRLARALAETRLHGVVSNRDLLVGILRHPEFRAGQIDTGFLSRHDPQELAISGRDPAAPRLHALAAALAGQAARRAAAPVLATIPSGWRNVPSGPQQVTFDCDGQQLAVRYRAGRDGVQAEVDGEPVEGLTLWSAEPGLVVADLAGIRREFSVTQAGHVYYVDSQLGATTLIELPRFPEPDSVRSPGSLLAPMPGTVVRIEVAPGAVVAAGTPVVVLEAMKMEHTVIAPHDGRVTSVGVAAGQPVDVGTVLAVVEAQHDE